MPKVTLKIDDFKALASDTRLDILKVLDGKKMSLNELTAATKLHKMILHEHLTKLVESGFVKRKEREGHKWVYYQLSWKGESLIHPENTKVVLLFTTAFITLLFGIIGLVNIVKSITDSQLSSEINDNGRTIPINKGSKGPSPDVGGSEGLFGLDYILLYVTIACFIIFIILIVVSVWKYKKNKAQNL
jgi:DNA-binding transcriptional ArsR family regulator